MLDHKNYNPDLAYGARINPSVIAGMIGLPYVGEIRYVDATNGSDTANGGAAQNDAFASLEKAYDTAGDNKHDAIIIIPGGVGSGSETSETKNISWTKNQVHVIGSCAPSPVSQRARIGWTTDEVDPCLTISGQGNTFANIQLATYEASNDVLVSLTSNRNVFTNVHFAGIGHETAGDDTSARCLSLSGAEENRFAGCTIGLDTVARSVANASLELASGSTRNVFEDCRFLSFVDSADALHVKIGSGGIDRFVEFTRCKFLNAIDSTATAMTVAMSINASAGGTVVWDNSSYYGATNLTDNFANFAQSGPFTDEADASASIGQAINGD